MNTQNIRTTGKIHNLAQRKSKGFTLLELMFVVAGGIVLIGIGLAIWSQVRGATGALSGSTGIMQITSGIKQLYHAPQYTGIDAATIIKTGKVPTTMVSGTSIVNAWGGQITIAPANYAGGTNNAFKLTVSNVPTDACNSVAAAVQDSFQIITVGSGAGTVIKDDSASPAVTLNVAAVANACAGSNNNTMAFTAI